MPDDLAQTERAIADDLPAPTLSAALDLSLAAFVRDHPLFEATVPLVEAVETAYPTSKAALFKTEKGRVLELLAAPTLSASDLDWLAAELGEEPYATTLHETGTLVGRTVRAPETGVRMCLTARPVLVSDTHVVGILALLTPAEDAERCAPPKDGELRRMARIAGLMIEDRLARGALRESEMLLGSLIATSPDGIIRIRRDNTIVSFSAAAERMFGYTEAEVIGKPMDILLTEDHAGRHSDYVERFLDTRRRNLPNFALRFEAITKTGTTIPIEIAIAELDTTGEPQFIGVVRDISARVATERRVDELRDALAHASQLGALGEMAATIAHEVNQPLGAIANYVDAALLQLAGDDSEAVRRARPLLVHASEQARLGGEIIRRLRRLTERLEPMAEPADLNRVLSDVTSSLTNTARGRGVRLETAFAPDLPIVRLDKVQIQQVAANLIRNAFDALADAPRKRVTVATRALPDAVEFSVADTGGGVAGELRERIFESFVTTRSQGIGLGLAIARSIILAHGGTIGVEDAEGGGALFRVRLPLGDSR